METRTSPHLPIRYPLTLAFILSFAITLLMAAASIIGLLTPDLMYPSAELRLSLIPNDALSQPERDQQDGSEPMAGARHPNQPARPAARLPMATPRRPCRTSLRSWPEVSQAREMPLAGSTQAS